MPAAARNQSLRVLMSVQERTMVEELAKREGLTASDVVRQLVRRAHTDAFGGQGTERRGKR